MNLYQIDRAILDLVDRDTGEILDWDAFDRLQLERDVKIENVACWYKNLVAEAKAIKAEEDALKRRRERIEAQAKKKREYLQEALCGEKFESARCAVSFRRTTSVHISDTSEVIAWAEAHDHKECVKYSKPELSKAELGKLLKAKVNVPGAKLVTGLSMGVK